MVQGGETELKMQTSHSGVQIYPGLTTLEDAMELTLTGDGI